MKIQVTACDIDRKVPAQTYTIQAQDGRSVTRDLCQMHAEPFEALLVELGEDEPEVEAEQEVRPEPKKRAPVTKTAAKKATSPRRRPKVTSLAEIEASKQKG
ncbi:hypothetical protein PQC18_gp28 [Streptomyces phage Pablito]|uniref:Uncharacterized protein n=1 Tax=Streptomyces phage Pablito TaxID=2894593 RepID=A0AAE8YF99_9CAUD|nr:hypothetical protein PQC18_gp28 [Streptomyces phage Pablito]UFD97966.1 hypothetical protein [Streptomyces phage Pablito]